MLKNQELIAKLNLWQKAALLSGQNTWETFAVNDELPSIFLSDGPHGLRKQLGETDHLGLNGSQPATCFPTAASLANSWDQDLLEKVGQALGIEAQRLQVDIVLGPGLNIKRNPRCGRNFEYYSEDPYLAGKMGAALIRGIQSTGKVACPKHFAANNQEYRRMSSNSVIDERALHEIYLTNFEIAVKEGKPLAIMSSYNQVNGTYANENQYLLQNILRDQWDFRGIVVSDWGGDNSHFTAVKNGNNLAMPTQGANGPAEIVSAIKNGKLSVDVVDQRIDELINVIKEVVAHRNPKVNFSWQKQHLLARKAAQDSIVLLKNDDTILPLAADKKVAIIGDFVKTPRYQGAGSSLVNPHHLEKIIDLLPKYNLNVSGIAQGYQRGLVFDEHLASEAVKLAKNSDVVVFFGGLDEFSESEGLDRTDLKLPFGQQKLLNKLLKLDQPVILVLSAGSPVELPWFYKLKAIVAGYLGGEAGAGALLDVLTGKCNPSGKLAETYPIAQQDVPFDAEFPVKAQNVYYKESIFVGYRYYLTKQVKVRFPFGFGLSYTTFAYQNLKVEDNQVQFDLINTGKVAGAETTQLYIAKIASKIARPLRELKGFAKINLQPGEMKKVTIPFDDKTFRFFDATKQKWAIEAGEYQILVGASSTDIRLIGRLMQVGKNWDQSVEFELPVAYKNLAIASISDEDFAVLLQQPLPRNQVDSQLTVNSPLSDLRYAQNKLSRLVVYYLQLKLKKQRKKGKPDLNTIFLYNMPFRAIAKMTNGQVSMQMVYDLVMIANGHFWHGLGSLLQDFIKNRQRIKFFKQKVGEQIDN